MADTPEIGEVAYEYLDYASPAVTSACIHSWRRTWWWENTGFGEYTLRNFTKCMSCGMVTDG